MKTVNMQAIINNGMLNAVLDQAHMFRFIPQDDGTTQFVIDRRARESLDLHEMNSDAYTGRVADTFHQQFSNIIAEQKPSEMLIPSIRSFLVCMEQHTRGIPVNAMQLALMAKGLDVGKIRIVPYDRTLINSTMATLKTVDGSGTTQASLWWLVNKLNDFTRRSTPEQRGVRQSNYKYSGTSKILAHMLSHRRRSQELIRSGLGMIPPYLFAGRHGQRVNRLLPEIGALAMERANTAYLRTLVRNNQPFWLKTQYLDDVTLPEKGNDWQRVTTAYGGEKVTHAEILRAARETFAAMANQRYRYGVATTLARLGIRVTVIDPYETLKRIHGAFIAPSNHEGYPDIGAEAIASINIPHSFVAHDGLPAITLGIGTFLVGANHTVIERTRYAMPIEEKLRIREWTAKEYGRVLDRGIPLFVFPQGTRSRQPDWRDLKKPGDRILEKKYRSSAEMLVEIALSRGVKIVPLHVVNTGKTFMPELIKGEMGDVLGSQLGLRYLLNMISMPVFGTKHMGRIEVHVAPLIDPAQQKPEDTIDMLIDWHNERYA